MGAAALLAALFPVVASAFGIDINLMSPDVLGGMLLLANAPMALPEQIANYEAKRQSLVDKATALIQKSVDEGRTLEESEAGEHAECKADIAAIDKHLVLLKDHQANVVSKATTVTPTAGTGQEEGTRGGSSVQVRPGVISVKHNLEPGIRFTRFAIAMACAKGNIMQAHEIAKVRFKDTPEVGNALQAAIHLGSTAYLNQKAAVAAGTTTDSSWAGPLVQYNDMESEFIELLRPMTILGKLTQLNKVPFNIRMARQLTGVSGSFVGEGAPKPVGRQTYDNVTLGWAKAAVIVVMTDELVRFSSPNAETRARDDMAKGIATYLDRRFIDPAYSGVANVSPASITNTARRIQMTGITTAAFDTAVASAMTEFTSSSLDPSTAVWIMSPAVALKLSMVRNTDGTPTYPAINMFGGAWYGLPAVVSASMSASGSPAEQQIALVVQDEVLLADDGGVTIDMSTEASVQMNDAPSAGAQSLVSLWQNNLIGIRAERYINWAPRRPSSLGIVLIENVNI